MRLPFLMRKNEREEPLVVSMTGARLGDQIIYAGTTPAFFMPLSARAGLSGQLTLVAPNAEDLKRAAEREGLLIEALTTPPPAGNYDFAILEARGPWIDDLSRLRATVRSGGRIIVIAGEPRGLIARLRGPAEPPPPDDAIVRALEAEGWTRGRGIGEQNGIRFVEAFNR
jgi:hypothetical protein